MAAAWRATAAWRARVLAEYRRALRLTAALPAAERPKALEGLRGEMRKHAGLAEEDKALDELRRLAARCGFLRMVTPARRNGDTQRSRSGSATYVLRDGELVQEAAESKGVRVADGAVSFDEGRRRNMKDMQRFNFGRKQSVDALRPFL